jgi:hypothetical protein
MKGLLIQWQFVVPQEYGRAASSCVHCNSTPPSHHIACPRVKEGEGRDRLVITPPPFFPLNLRVGTASKLEAARLIGPPMLHEIANHLH